MVYFRFDNLGSVTEKLDPTYRKCQTAGETVVQILLAAACGDKLFLQRYKCIRLLFRIKATPFS